MAAPQLTRRLALEEKQATPDGAGGFVQSWTVLGHHWAEVAARTGSARTGEFGTVSRLPLKITVRGVPQDHPARPQAGQRFHDGARVYAVDAVHEADPHGRYLTCFAHEEATA